MKALLAHPDVPREHDPAALPLFLTYGYVPTPGTFYRHIRSLPPGHQMVVTEDGRARPTPVLETSASRAETAPAATDDREAEEQFRTLLRAAVKRRLVADVPLGRLSLGRARLVERRGLHGAGGEGRVKTFCIGFKDGGAYDERAHARVVAQHFGTEHTEFVVEPKALELDRPPGLAPRRALRRQLGRAHLPALRADARAT